MGLAVLWLCVEPVMNFAPGGNLVLVDGQLANRMAQALARVNFNGNLPYSALVLSRLDDDEAAQGDDGYGRLIAELEIAGRVVAEVVARVFGVEGDAGGDGLFGFFAVVDGVIGCCLSAR